LETGVKGFEPMMPVPKTGALPLGYTPTGKKGLEPITFGFGDQCSTIELPSLKGNNQT
jgi:hypothetical protein